MGKISGPGDGKVKEGGNVRSCGPGPMDVPLMSSPHRYPGKGSAAIWAGPDTLCNKARSTLPHNV